MQSNLWHSQSMSEKLQYELNVVFDHNSNLINEWLEADFKQEELFQVLQEMKSGDFN